jgi:hypothetical protein
LAFPKSSLCLFNSGTVVGFVWIHLLCTKF